MAEIDTRFLALHPATALWWEQRKKCRACKHHSTRAANAQTQTGGGEYCDGVNMAYRRFGNPPPCIEARDQDAPCGPNAAMFSPK